MSRYVPITSAPPSALRRGPAKSVLAMFTVLAAACGGSSPRPAAHYAPPEPALEPQIAEQRWYRAVSTCAQGPWELEVPARGAKYGEEVELRLKTPRAIALHAELIVDDAAPQVIDTVLDANGSNAGKPDNARCIADARERLALARGGGTGTGTPGTPGTPGRLVVPPPDRPAQTAQLELDDGDVSGSIEVISVRVPDGARRVRIRFWSVEPNDLAGVLFGLAHVEWRPNVAEADYVAYLRMREERARAAVVVPAPVVVVPAPVVTVRVDAETERRHREAEERGRIEAEKRRLRLEREAEEARRRRAIRDALEAERRIRRQAFCASHPKDRGCWGPGGFAMHVEFENHRKERASYCAAHPEDARCWTYEERSRRTKVWQARLDAAVAPPKQPDGPPPDPLAEEMPPRLSAHAEWRPGYWQWTAGTWVWLAGMWRVPDEDIARGETTTAPAAPPPPRPEAPPPPPVSVAVWVPGFWQWNGSTWIWITGSYQLRPDARTTWRAAEWQPRGAVHVLIPGGWVRIGGGR